MPDTVVDVLAVIFAVVVMAPALRLIRGDGRSRQDVGGGDIGAGDGWTHYGHDAGHGAHGDGGGNGDGGGDGGADGGSGH